MVITHTVHRPSCVEGADISFEMQSSYRRECQCGLRQASMELHTRPMSGRIRVMTHIVALFFCLGQEGSQSRFLVFRCSTWPRTARPLPIAFSMPSPKKPPETKEKTPSRARSRSSIGHMSTLPGNGSSTLGGCFCSSTQPASTRYSPRFAGFAALPQLRAAGGPLRRVERGTEAPGAVCGSAMRPWGGMPARVGYVISIFRLQ